MSGGVRLLTVGHGTLPAERFAALLHEAGALVYWAPQLTLPTPRTEGVRLSRGSRSSFTPVYRERG